MLECVWSQHLSTNLYRVHLRTNQIRYYASQFSDEEIPDFGNDEICKSVNQKYPESPWKILWLFEIGNSSPVGRKWSTTHTVNVENASQKNKVKPLISRYHTLETQLVEAPKFNVKPKTYSLHIWLWERSESIPVIRDKWLSVHRFRYYRSPLHNPSSISPYIKFTNKTFSFRQ